MACPPHVLTPHTQCNKTPWGPLKLASAIMHSTLDSRLQLSCNVTAIDMDIASLHHDAWVFMPEDPRAFEWHGEGWVIYNDEFHQYRQMHMQRVLPTPLPSIPLSPPGGPDPHKPPDYQGIRKRWEKNWVAIGPTGTSIDDNDDYLFARRLEPHEIFRCSRQGTCRNESATSHEAFFQSLLSQYQYIEFHLGTNAVRVSATHYGAIMHGVTHPPKKRKHYDKWPYLFRAEAPYEIEQIASRPLELALPPGLPDDTVYANSLTFVDGLLVLSYSVENESICMHVDKADTVFKDMVPVT